MFDDDGPIDAKAQERDIIAGQIGRFCFAVIKTGYTASELKMALDRPDLLAKGCVRAIMRAAGLRDECMPDPMALAMLVEKGLAAASLEKSPLVTLPDPPDDKVLSEALTMAEHC